MKSLGIVDMDVAVFVDLYFAVSEAKVFLDMKL
jgi:hypothetical protein